jgi:hypothetical protein
MGRRGQAEIRRAAGIVSERVRSVPQVHDAVDPDARRNADDHENDGR